MHQALHFLMVAPEGIKSHWLEGASISGLVEMTETEEEVCWLLKLEYLGSGVAASFRFALIRVPGSVQSILALGKSRDLGGEGAHVSHT